MSPATGQALGSPPLGHCEPAIAGVGALCGVAKHCSAPTTGSVTVSRESPPWGRLRLREVQGTRTSPANLVVPRAAIGFCIPYRARASARRGGVQGISGVS